eukprot:scaffold411013_cov54-Prasinocladus_malaysianus.AAC.1
MDGGRRRVQSHLSQAALRQVSPWQRDTTLLACCDGLSAAQPQQSFLILVLEVSVAEAHSARWHSLHLATKPNRH